MRYCRACVLPDTRPNLTLDAQGICNACRTHASKPDIDWVAREQTFRRLVDGVRARSTGYDCLIPVSGGKDSTWQTVKCLEYGLTPLAVTWKTPGRTAIGQRNLDNLVALGVDHIDYQINPKLEARFMVKAFERYGSTAIPMHLALFNIPLTIAAKFDIPLVVWGENSAFEYGSADEAHTGFRLDRAWYQSYGVTHGTTAADWVDADLPRKQLAAYFGPDPDELERRGVHAVFLGYYFPWDPQTSLAVARAHHFEFDCRRRAHRLLRLCRHRRRFHLDSSLVEMVQVRLHAPVRQSVAGDSQRPHDARAGDRDHPRAQAIRRRMRTSRSSARLPGSASQRFFEIAERFRNHAIWTRDGRRVAHREFSDRRLEMG